MASPASTAGSSVGRLLFFAPALPPDNRIRLLVKIRFAIDNPKAPSSRLHLLEPGFHLGWSTKLEIQASNDR